VCPLLVQLGPSGQEMHETILRQSELDLSLCKLMLELKAVRGHRAGEAERRCGSCCTTRS